MTEICFNDLTARVGTATVALESVTATVIEIDLYVYWKPGFRIKLEALLSTGLSAVGVLDAVTAAVFDLDLYV